MFEEKDVMQGYKALKYFSTIIVVVMRTAFGLNKGDGWWIMAVITSAIAPIISTYWDIFLDWGLLQRNSQNRWLRDKLILKSKKVYIVAMVLNIILRLAWLQSVLEYNLSFMHPNAMVAIVACLEIIRRGIWNFFRPRELGQMREVEITTEADRMQIATTGLTFLETHIAAPEADPSAVQVVSDSTGAGLVDAGAISSEIDFAGARSSDEIGLAGAISFKNDFVGVSVENVDDGDSPLIIKHVPVIVDDVVVPVDDGVVPVIVKAGVGFGGDTPSHAINIVKDVFSFAAT